MASQAVISTWCVRFVGALIPDLPRAFLDIVGTASHCRFTACVDWALWRSLRLIRHASCVLISTRASHCVRFSSRIVVAVALIILPSSCATALKARASHTPQASPST
ncbi:hypothetical protein V8E55_001352 [Tylopilus felleus]